MKTVYSRFEQNSSEFSDVYPDFLFSSQNITSIFQLNEEGVVYFSRLYCPICFELRRSMRLCCNSTTQAWKLHLSKTVKLRPLASFKMHLWKTLLLHQTRGATSVKLFSHRQGFILFKYWQTLSDRKQFLVTWWKPLLAKRATAE